MSFPILVTFEQLLADARKLAPGALEDFIDLACPDTNDGDDESLIGGLQDFGSAYLSNEKLRNELAQCGYLVDGNKVLAITYTSLIAAKNMFELIHDEIDYVDGKPSFTWQYFGLQSDSDSDYCGSHGSMFVELLLGVYAR